MERKRLIFFVTDTDRVGAAYRFAMTAGASNLDAEVRLAGDAVLVADPAWVATAAGADALRECIDAGAQDHVASVCPRSVAARGITDDQVVAIGARARPLADILTEVAEGQSVLVHLG